MLTQTLLVIGIFSIPFSLVIGRGVSFGQCFRASTLALRSGSFVTLSVMVSIGGKESSYKGTMKLLLPDGLTAHQPLPYSCTKATEGISCELPNPMTVGEKVRRGNSGDDVGKYGIRPESILL